MAKVQILFDDDGYLALQNASNDMSDEKLRVVDSSELDNAHMEFVLRNGDHMVLTISFDDLTQKGFPIVVERIFNG